VLCRRWLDVYGCKAILIEPGFHQTNIASLSHVGSMYQQAWDDLPSEMKAEFGEEFPHKGCFLPRDARSAKRGITIVSRPSVCLSVRPSVCLSVCLSVCDVDVPWAYRLD